jgi:hypothetical protein
LKTFKARPVSFGDLNHIMQRNLQCTEFFCPEQISFALYATARHLNFYITSHILVGYMGHLLSNQTGSHLPEFYDWLYDLCGAVVQFCTSSAPAPSLFAMHSLRPHISSGIKFLRKKHRLIGSHWRSFLTFFFFFKNEEITSDSIAQLYRWIFRVTYLHKIFLRLHTDRSSMFPTA